MEFPRFVLVAVLLFAAGAAFASDRPNILWITSDEVGGYYTVVKVVPESSIALRPSRLV